MGDSEIGEEPGHAGIENEEVFSARLVAESAVEPALALAARPDHEQIAAFGDPAASGELEEQCSVECARALIVDVLDAAWRSLATLARISNCVCRRSVSSCSSSRLSYSA
jgi:hypothetical protein